jgi:hypothetical protein
VFDAEGERVDDAEAASVPGTAASTLMRAL